MRIAFGFKAHSGWAALVAIGKNETDLEVVDRRRVELVDSAQVEWAKQPYHAAEGLKSSEARKIVKRGIDSARRIAIREMKSAVSRALAQGHTVTGCALLVGEPMPEWSVEEILAVHFRMHKAEGVLFREVIANAAEACGLKVVPVPEKSALEHAQGTLRTSPVKLNQILASLGKSIGPPWGKDQKDAALAALVALV
jgi:hypothetical protein